MLSIRNNKNRYYKDVIVDTFPNGEINFSKKNIDYLKFFDKSNKPTIFFKWENDSSLIELYLFSKYLEQYNLLNIIRDLEIAYLPYSRMDRIENGNIYSLKYISELINSLGYDKVRIHEPHTFDIYELINNAEDLPTTLNLLQYYLIENNITKPFTIVLPDKGAYKRYVEKLRKVLYNFNYKYSIIHCKKERDFETGKIKKIRVDNDSEIVYNKCIIIDDLVSYGGTFIGCKNALNNLGVVDVDLIVTHAEYAILNGKLLSSDFNNIVATNSMLPFSDTQLKTFKYKADIIAQDTNFEIKDIKNY